MRSQTQMSNTHIPTMRSLFHPQMNGTKLYKHLPMTVFLLYFRKKLISPQMTTPVYQSKQVVKRVKNTNPVKNKTKRTSHPQQVHPQTCHLRHQKHKILAYKNNLRYHPVTSILSYRNSHRTATFHPINPLSINKPKSKLKSLQW